MNAITKVVRRAAAVTAAAALGITASAAGAAVETRSATVDGIKLEYLYSGKGRQTPVLLLHGYTQTSHMWLPLIAKLDDRRVVIAPDLRGAGGSDKPESGYDKKTLAQDVHALVKSLGYPKVKVVGHDIGLMVAYAYAAQYPDEVESVVLMDAFLPGVGDWTKVWLLRDLWHFHFHGEVPEKLVAGRERIYFEHFWNDFAADRDHSIPEADRRYYAAAYAQPGGIHAGFEYFKAFEQDAADFAGFARTRLTTPMLVLTGGKASGTFLIDQARLVDSNVDGRVIENSGHWLLEEAPAQVIPALVDFLDRN
ncbi:alpha/beta fold hydrolase [Tahibacter caeni]|uniref:alpha/beta fold hydrolase n=1 Tax=Tahibacter caeni TaxID=1453545 RepID=UPI0021490921|nr:alpha/beta hydrolase [Tahibacter caeni]